MPFSVRGQRIFKFFSFWWLCDIFAILNFIECHKRVDLVDTCFVDKIFTDDSVDSFLLLVFRIWWSLLAFFFVTFELVDSSLHESLIPVYFLVKRWLGVFLSWTYVFNICWSTLCKSLSCYFGALLFTLFLVTSHNACVLPSIFRNLQ